MKLIDIEGRPGWRYFKGHPYTRIEKTAKIVGNVEICDSAWVYENARVYGNSKINNNAMISGNAVISEDANIYGHAKVSGYTVVYGNAKVEGHAQTSEYAVVHGHAKVDGNAIINGYGEILKTEDYMVIESPNRFFRHLTLHRDKKIGIRINYFDFSGTLEEYIFEYRKTNNQYFHQGMMTKYYNIFKDRMTPLE